MGQANEFDGRCAGGDRHRSVRPPGRAIGSAAEPRGYILVIDDDPGVREGIAGVIASEGYPVVSCEDAKEALDRLQMSSDLPRMIVLDFMMPRMDGWTFLSERKKDERLKNIPVLGMSASQLLVDQRKPPDDVDEFLRKPFKVETMLRSIEKHWSAVPG